MVFSDKKQTNGKIKRRGAAFHESAVTILTPGCHFDGKLYCRGSSRIGGKIDGEIVSEGLLIIEEEAMITAKVKADEVVIQGQVKGRLEATHRVELTATSQFEGDIVTPSLIINEGAQFNGHTSMQARRPQSNGLDLPVIEPVKKRVGKLKNSDYLGGPEIELNP